MAGLLIVRGSRFDRKRGEAVSGRPRMATMPHRAVGTVALLCFSILHASQGEDITPGRARQLIQAAISSGAVATGTLVDPRLITDLSVNLIILTANFCDNNSLASPVCRDTVAKPAILRRAVEGYLRDVAVDMPTSVTSVAGRLAAIAKVDLGYAGWPPTVPNDAGVIEIPPAWQAATISVQTASGSVVLGRGRRIVARPGGLTLLVDEGSGRRMTVGVSVPVRGRVSLTASPQADHMVASARIDTAEERFCRDEGTPVLSLKPGAALVPFLFDRGSAGPDSAAYRSPMTKAIALDIEFVDAAGACDQACRIKLGASFVEAVATWKAGCERCDENALTVVRMLEKVWLDSRIVRRARRTEVSRDSLSLDLNERDPAEVRLKTPLLGYDDLAGETAVRETLCSSDSKAPWVRDFKALACTQTGASAVSLVRPKVVVTAGPTACGPSVDFVACGSPGDKVEITIAGAKLTSIAERQVLAFGDSRIWLDDVVFHEVGHWFGVPHSDAPIIASKAALDIMAETYGDGGRRCISRDTLSLLNNAADMRWPFRISAGGGLKRPARMVQ